MGSIAITMAAAPTTGSDTRQCHRAATNAATRVCQTEAACSVLSFITARWWKVSDAWMSGVTSAAESLSVMAETSAR
jgi:hypothetical protein